MTLLLQQDTDQQDKNNSDEIPINDELVISAPVKSEQMVHVRYNSELNLFEGLPKEWRDLLELPFQLNEID